MLADGERGARPAGRLGLAWGAGHAETLLALGLPVLLAGLHGGAESAAALVQFALGTACSMALASAAWGRVLAGGAVERRLPLLAPAFGAAGLAFGCWYGAMAAMG